MALDLTMTRMDCESYQPDWRVQGLGLRLGSYTHGHLRKDAHAKNAGRETSRVSR